MWIGHRKEIRKLMFRALALRRTESNSDVGLTLETLAFESLYAGQFTWSTQLIKPNYRDKSLFQVFDLAEASFEMSRWILSLGGFDKSPIFFPSLALVYIF